MHKNLKKLEDIIKKSGKILIAYSGGVDSTFLLRFAVDTLGADRVLAVTARSASYPAAELKEARVLAAETGCRHMVIESEELLIPGFKDNPPDRCYYCKKELFGKLINLARSMGYDTVADASNADDTADYRPGKKAAQELGVRHPLLEAGITKDIERAYLKIKRVSIWNKPSMACLSSRFPYGEEITTAKLDRIGKAEALLRKAGFTQVRVRYFGQTAKIELYPAEFKKLLASPLREGLIKKFSGLGFTNTLLDLKGYRTGSMNEELKKKGKKI